MILFVGPIFAIPKSNCEHLNSLLILSGFSEVKLNCNTTNWIFAKDLNSPGNFSYTDVTSIIKVK